MYAIYTRKLHTLRFYKDSKEPVVRSPKGTYLPTKALTTKEAKFKSQIFDNIILYVHKRGNEHKYIFSEGKWRKVGKVNPIKVESTFKESEYKSK